MPSNDTLYFVKVGEFDGKLQQAFESAKIKELDVEIVSGEELLEKGVDQGKIVFVTDQFTGDVFELLHAHQKTIFGPICVLECVETGTHFPADTSHPVYSLAMSGARVSCTNVARTLRKKLKQLIEYMNGVFAKDFSCKVTHLVAGEVGREKYAIAASLKKPIVLPSWVEEAWQRMLNDRHFDAKDANFVDEHRCPIFKAFSICVTGLDSRRRNEIKRLVEENGGKFSAALKMKVTTHLLVEKPEGQKYEFSQRWGLHCVQPNWLFDCINGAYWLDETPYLVKPVKELNSTCVTITHSTTTVDSTINSTVSVLEVSRKAALAAEQSAASHGSKELLIESSLARIQGHGLKGLHKSKRLAQKAGTCDYDVSIPLGELFLDGCQLYLTGFSQSQLDCLQKIINAGGGTRFNQINPSVSHIVVGDKPAQDIEQLVNSEFSPHVVTVQWLLESCRQVKCLSEQEFSILKSNDVFEEERKSNEENKEKKVVEKRVAENKDEANDEILSQYLELMPNDDPTLAMRGEHEPAVIVAKNLDTSDGKSNPAEASKECDQDVLSGFTFCWDGFAEEQEAKVQATIESYGGSVLPSKSKTLADFIVVPLIYECEENMPAKTVVTGCWLERCVECGEILEPSGEFSFTPFSLPEDVFPLQDCVISISQYADATREHLIDLIEVLGGYYQEYFSRKTYTNLMANTHLVLQEPTGSKYNAAVNWNIPTVGADWLYECARTANKVPETRYLLTPTKSPGVEKDQQGQLEDKPSCTFHELTAPENRPGKEEQESHSETGDKSETSVNNTKAKEKEIASSLNKQAQPITWKVPPFFGKRPVFDLTDAFECVPSPCASSSAHSRLSRGSSNSFLMDDYIQEQLQTALSKTSKLVESRKGSVQEHEGSTIDNGDNNEEKENASGASSFLSDVILVVTKKCVKQLSEIHKIATSVGAECKNSLDQSCTHLIHEGRLTKEQSQAKSKGIHVVSPHWLYDCIEQQCHLDESLYPPSYNPKLTLSVVKTRRSTRSTKDITDDVNADVSKVNSEKTSPDPRNAEETHNKPGGVSSETGKDEKGKEIAMDDLQASEMEAIAAFSQSSAQSDSLRTREEIKHIHDLMQSMKSSRRRSSRTRSSGNSVHSRNSSGNSGNESKRRPSSRLRSLRPGKDDSDEEDEGQTMDEITYDDPKSRQERERIIAQLEDENSPTTPSPNIGPTLNNDETIDGNEASRTTEKSNATDDVFYQKHTIKTEAYSPTSPMHSSTPTAPSIALQITSKSDLPEPVSLLDSAERVEKVEIKPCPKFTFTVMSQQEKIDYGALIEDLGGVVFDNQFFNSTSRHLIAGKLTRNEKCLSSIAAGNWVLRKSYLEACRKAGCFVDEEAHEWGVEIPGESLESLAIASRRWRIELAKKSARHKKSFGAFKDWKILLCVEDNRVGSFERVLAAGGAEVLGTKPPFQKIAHATHAFISPEVSHVNNIDFGRLEQYDVLVLKTQYISDYLIETPAPPTLEYLYRPLQSSRKRKQYSDSELPQTPGKKKKEH